MNRGCLWASIVMIGLFLLVAGVIVPRSILSRKNCRTPEPTLITVPSTPTLSPSPSPTPPC